MSFSSLQEFLAMGGHGLYVWLSYGAAAIIVLYNVVSVRVAERRFIEDARDRQRRHQSAATPPAETRPGPAAATASAGGRPVTGESRSP